MIEICCKIILIIIFLLIFWQDSKDRLVYWFLYPLVGIVAFVIEGNRIGYLLAILTSLINLLLILIIIITGYLYSTLILRKKFVNESLGMGDLLLFIFLCFTFATTTFIILFVFSLFFSLILHQYFKNRSDHKTVPLAGYISLFFAAVYLISFFIHPKYLFA